MKITNVISPRGCYSGACPSLHLTDDGSVLVQGARLRAEERPGLPVPEHEDLVRIPKTVFEDLLSQYRDLQ